MTTKGLCFVVKMPVLRKSFVMLFTDLTYVTFFRLICKYSYIQLVSKCFSAKETYLQRNSKFYERRNLEKTPPS